jgi:eukaryotic-like serine/threonine-protein kinase
MSSDPEIVNRRYELLSEIGAGGMGSVYRAYDRLRGEYVALKRVLMGENAGSEEASLIHAALIQEFKLLATLRHPNIIRVLDYGLYQNQPFFTMELLEAPVNIIDASERQPPQGQTPLEWQIKLMVQLLNALVYVHRRHIIHCDLKPSNVLLADDAVKVLDFGLSNIQGKSATQGAAAGTLAYMAPETLMGDPPTIQSDLYAVGVIGYELFSGEHPFTTENATVMLDEILYKKMILALDKLSDKNEALAWVVERLLSKRPDGRYSDAVQVINAILAATGENLPPENMATRDSFLQAAQLVGREAELALLDAALLKAAQGEGSAWLVGGENGIGKTRLLDELRVLALIRGGNALRSAGVSEGSSPYSLWRETFQWLALVSQDTPQEPDGLALAALVKAFGVKTVYATSTLPNLANAESEASAQQRSVQTKLFPLMEKILRTQTEPLLIVLEDLQWAGTESLALINQLAAVVAKLPVLLVCSYRSDEVPNLAAVLPAIDKAHHMRLPRLSPEEIARLSTAMLGTIGQQNEIVELLQRETEGNIYFVIEVMRALAEEAGRLEDIKNMTLPQHVFTGGIKRIVERRLARLDEEAEQMFRFAAAAGRILDLALLRAAYPPTKIEQWILVGSDAAVIDVHENTWAFTHDKLRESLLVGLLPDDLADLHRRIAAAIEQVYPNAPEQAPVLFYHWEIADNAAKVLQYGEIAGKQALLGGAYYEAQTYLGRAVAVLEKETNQYQRTIEARNLLGDAYLGLANYEAATLCFNQNLAQARLHQDLSATANALCRLGDIDYARDALDKADLRYQGGLALYQQANDSAGIVAALQRLGNVAFDLGDDDRAYKFYQESLSLSRKMGTQWGKAGSVSGEQPDD